MGRTPMPDDLATLANRGAPFSSGLEHDAPTAHYRQPGFASHATLSSATPSPGASLSLPASSMLSRFAPSESSDSVAALFAGLNTHQALSEAARGTASALSISSEKQLAHSIAHLQALAQPQDRTSTALSAARDIVAQQPPMQAGQALPATAKTTSANKQLPSVDTIATMVLQAVARLTPSAIPENHSSQAQDIVGAPDSFKAQTVLEPLTTSPSAERQNTQSLSEDPSQPLTPASLSSRDLVLAETLASIASSLESLSRRPTQAVPAPQQGSIALDTTRHVTNADGSIVKPTDSERVQAVPTALPGTSNDSLEASSTPEQTARAPGARPTLASTADEQDALTLLFSRPSSVSVNAASLAEIRDAIADMIVALTSASSSSDSRAAYLDEPTARLATAAPDVQTPAEPALLPDTSNSQATNSETLTDSARLAEIRDALADMIVALTSASSSSDTRAVYLDEPTARLATTAPDAQTPAEPALLPDTQATNSETLTDSARLAEIRDALADMIVALTSASSSSDTRAVYLDEPTARLLTTTAPDAQGSAKSAISPTPFTSFITNGEALTTEVAKIEVAKITAGLRTLYQLLSPGSLAVAEDNPRAYPLEDRFPRSSPLTLLSPTQQSASSHASVQPTQPLTELDEIAQRISLVSSYSAQSWPAAQATSSVANTADTLSAIQGHTPRPEPSSPAMFMATQPPPTSLSTELVNTWSTLPNVTLSGSPIVAASMPYPQDDGSQKPIATSGEPTTLLPMATSTAGSQLSTATPAQLVALPALVSSPAWPPQFGQQLLHFITRGGEQHIQMKLNPSDLGPLSVSLKMTEQGTQAQFLSAHAHVRQVLEQAIPQLREMLAEQGITLSDTFVGDQGAGDQRFEHQRGPGQRGDESDMANEHNQPHSADSLVSVSPDGRVDLYA